MAIPFQGEPIQSFNKGLSTGTDMFAKIMNARYNNSLHPSGDVANAMYVEQLKNQYGENDPRYLQAKAAHDMAMSGHQSLMDYRTQLSNLAPFRATSPLGKSIAEGRGQGALDKYGSYDNNGETGGYDPEVARAYEQDIAKKTTDPDARKRYLFAQNIDKTRAMINPQDLLSYSGLEGTGQYVKDQALSTSGKAPERLINHKKSLTAANTLAKQVRQFYGDSIQPEMEKKLTALTNPALWYKNPDLAMAEFKAFNDILDAETDTYKQAGTSPVKLVKQENELTPEQKSSATPANQEDDFLNAVSASLSSVNPNITPENIRHTAKAMGISIEEAVSQLVKKYGPNKGGQ